MKKKGDRLMITEELSSGGIRISEQRETLYATNLRRGGGDWGTKKSRLKGA